MSLDDPISSRLTEALDMATNAGLLSKSNGLACWGSRYPDESTEV
jgi:hypothetical protein